MCLPQNKRSVEQVLGAPNGIRSWYLKDEVRVESVAQKCPCNGEGEDSAGDRMDRSIFVPWYQRSYGGQVMSYMKHEKGYLRERIKHRPARLLASDWFIL